MIDINIPEVVAEVEKAFARYEHALVTNDVAELDALFWKNSAHPALRRNQGKCTATMRSPPFAPGARPPISRGIS